MTTGLLLIGIGFVLIYPQIEKTVTAVDGPQRLPVMTFEVGRAVGSQTVAISELKCDLWLALSAMKCDMVNSLDGISEKLLALQRKVDPIGDQNGQME